eukprot:SAG25_NODE_563_length_6908_cov_10.085035_8_plen_100_part_00
MGANLSAAKRAGSANSHICPYFQILRYVQGVFEVMYRSEVFIGHPPPPPRPARAHCTHFTPPICHTSKLFRRGVGSSNSFLSVTGDPRWRPPPPPPAWN